MGGCQNYGPFLGTLNIRGRNRDPERDHNFDYQPHEGLHSCGSHRASKGGAPVYTLGLFLV